MALTINDLFTPAPSGVGTNPNLAPGEGTWLATLIEIAQTVGLPTTSWQPGGPERTILAIMAVALSQSDGVVSLMAQGGFLDFAATGTVTTTWIDGSTVTVPVTPDPSNPSQNNNGAPGWLDALGTSFYDVTRLSATYATGPLTVVNTTALAKTYSIGTYHVANTVTSATYYNAAAISIPSSQRPGTSGVITAVIPGVSTTTITTQTAHGLATNQVVYVSGTVGLNGLNGTFATITSTPTSTRFTIGAPSSGTWTSGGAVFLCSTITAKADVIGIASNASVGQVSTTVTQNNGVFVYNLTAWSASNYETNVAYAARCRLKLAAVSPNGPSQAYEYFALTAQQLLAEETPPIALTNGAIIQARAYSNPNLQTVSCVIASTTPASTTLNAPVTPGCTQLAITGATNATPIVITTATAHGLITGDVATISGVLGNTAANGTNTVTFVSGTSFSINASVGSGTYTGGGVVDGGDLGQVDALLRANVEPDSVTLVTQSALAFPLTISATVVVPQAYLSTYQVAGPLAIQNLIVTYPVGGNIPPGETDGTIPISAIEGALVDAGVVSVGGTSYVRQVSNLLVNGIGTGGSDPLYPSPDHYALIASVTISVIGV